MNTEYKGIEDMDIGIQNDGEPAVVAEPVAEPVEVEVIPEAEKPAEDPKPEDTPEQPHKKTGSQRARERAEREANLRMQAERERDELKAKLEGLNKPVVDTDEPQLENFEDLAAWKSALVSHAEKKAAASAEAKFKADQQRKALEDAQKKWQAEDAKFAATKTDWDDTLEDLTDAVRSLPPECEPGFNAIDAALNASEIAPAIKYHFGKHPEELRRIATLDPIGAIKEMARLEVRLSEPTPPKPTSKAPPPMRPVSGNPVASSEPRFGGIEEY